MDLNIVSFVFRIDVLSDLCFVFFLFKFFVVVVFEDVRYRYIVGRFYSVFYGFVFI